MSSCRLTFGASKYDLTRLSALTLGGEGTTADHYRYALNPCGLVPATSCGIPTTPRAGVMACQTSNVNTFVSTLGFIDGFKGMNATFIERKEHGSGVVMTLRNGDGCGGPPRTMVVTFICDAKVKSPTAIDVDESPSCTFNIALKAADACPLGSSGDKPSAFLDGGAIVVIVFVVVVTVYLVSGLLIRRLKHGYRGLETIPHRKFWGNLLALAVGGCRFSFSKVCCVSNSTYQSV